MKRLSEKWIMLYVTLSSFLLMILVTMSYSLFTGRVNEWFANILQIQKFRVPFIVYLLVFATIIGVSVMGIVYYINRKQYGHIEENLRKLVNGKYEDLLSISSSNQQVYTSQIFYEIDQYLISVSKKLIELSKEAQALNVEPKLVDGETKEEILEGERHRLARELHDSVSQQLFAAMMLLSALNEQVNDENPVFQKQLKMVESIINDSQSEMRALLLHLRPVKLEGKSLKKGIELLLVELKSKIQIQMKWDIDDVTLANGMEDHLFRIAQELLSNTLRHAKAKELDVYLKRTEQSVLLKFVDDGIGFDMNAARSGNYGLQNIRERVFGMGGSCKIISFPGQGTSVEIRIPVLTTEEVETDDKSIVD